MQNSTIKLIKNATGNCHYRNLGRATPKGVFLKYDYKSEFMTPAIIKEVIESMTKIDSMIHRFSTICKV